MKKPPLLPLLLASTTLVGCAGYVKHWTPIVQAQVGQNINGVIRSWGPPSTVYEATPGPNKFYVWNDEESDTTPGQTLTHKYGNGPNGPVVNHTQLPGRTRTYTYYRMLTVTPDGRILDGQAGVRKPK